MACMPTGKRAAASQKAVAAHIAKLSPTSTCSAAWRNYSRFCVAQRVPSFPIPSPMLALWLHDKCSSPHHYPKTYQSLLEGCASAANHVWAGEPSFEALSKLDPTGQAVREFMSERKVLWNRHALGASRPSALRLRRADALVLTPPSPTVKSLTLTTPSVSSSSISRSTAPDTPDAASGRSRVSLRPRAGPSVAPPPSSSRALRWKSRAERKAADEQAELESDEAEVFIPRKKRLRRGERGRSSGSDEGSVRLIPLSLSKRFCSLTLMPRRLLAVIVRFVAQKEQARPPRGLLSDFQQQPNSAPPHTASHGHLVI